MLLLLRSQRATQPVRCRGGSGDRHGGADLQRAGRLFRRNQQQLGKHTEGDAAMCFAATSAHVAAAPKDTDDGGWTYSPPDAQQDPAYAATLRQASLGPPQQGRTVPVMLLLTCTTSCHVTPPIQLLLSPMSTEEPSPVVQRVRYPGHCTQHRTAPAAGCSSGRGCASTSRRSPRRPWAERRSRSCRRELLLGRAIADVIYGVGRALTSR